MDSKEKYTAVLIVVFVLVVALIGGGLLLKSQRGDESLDEENEAVAETTEADPAADVVVTLEEFCDYQSQTCVEIGSTIKKLKQEYGKNLNVVFRNLPLPANKNALPAAQAAEAARMQSRFWEMHDLLYAKQSEWKDEENPREKFLQFARELGIDVERFTRDMDSEQVRLRLEADKDAALALSLQEIPAVVIDGRRLKTDAMTAEGIREGIELMLTRGVEDPPTPTP